MSIKCRVYSNKLFMHIHILGICGTFMGGLAQIAVAAGHKVSGCDDNVYPPMSSQLGNAGIELIEGFAAEQTAIKPDAFVIGNAISRTNPLLEAILAQGLPYISGPQWLAEQILPGRWVLAVAGTHGKTTTSAMLAWILEDAGLNPGFLIGGVPENFAVSARIGATPFFVIEADEYDSAFCDKRSKFIHYRPRTVILNNLEFDHADIFDNLTAIERQFEYLIRTLPANGMIVANANDARLQRVLERGCWTPVELYGNKAGLHLLGDDARDEIVLRDGEQELARGNWLLCGEHNRANACAALLAARHAGVPLAIGVQALQSFQNVKRRLQLRGTFGGVSVYDDFAHHPTAIAATLSAMRSKAGRSRIIAVFEPRSNTMRRGTLKDRLAASFAEADRVYCYSSGLDWDAAAALAPSGSQEDSNKAVVSDDFTLLIDAIVDDVRPGDQIVIMSNGDFQAIQEKLLCKLAAKYTSGAIAKTMPNKQVN